MKKLPLILSIISLAGVIALAVISLSKGGDKKSAEAEATETVAQKGAIVYFNLDRLYAEYDMANELRSVFETKVNSINEEVNRRGSKLDKDAKDFQDKVNKGLFTQSVAESRYQKLQEQQNSFQTYAAQKQQEIAEEQQVMVNQLEDAIKTYIDEFNAEKQYAMILTTQGNLLHVPVVAGDEALDITDELLAGLNAAYVKEKGSASKAE